MKKHTSVVTTGSPESPGVPTRNGFNGFLRALLGDRACLPPSSADQGCPRPVGPTRHRELDTRVGASGPHDFAVRISAVRPPPPPAPAAPAAPASTAPRTLTSVTIAKRPLCVGRDGGGYRGDLGRTGTG